MVLLKEIKRKTKRYFFSHGLEEITLLKCTYYPKQFMDSMQFL